ncbi:MAG: DegT/DnrJ/EryC1/StrS family aminotransferase [Muribaculaceae bacterium]
MKKYQFLNLKNANAPLIDEIEEAVCRVLQSGRYLHGDETARLESDIAQLCETRHCVAVSNGLDALRLIIMAYKEMGVMQDGDEIIVPANTYIASVLAISQCGLIPRFVDANTSTLNLDTNLIEETINARTRAIMPVHLYGTPCCDETLIGLAKTYDLILIEDNAQAINAKSAVTGLWGTFSTGGLGNASAISFYPTKNLGAMGDAGAVTTNDETLANAVRALANYGADRRYHNIYKGVNCRIDEIQAAILRVKLRHLDEETNRRQAVADAYTKNINNPAITTPTSFSNMRQVWHQYPIMVTARDEFREYLKMNGVDTDIHYAVPPHLQPCYKELANSTLPVTEHIANHEVSLPIGAPITVNDATIIAQIINGFIN